MSQLAKGYIRVYTWGQGPVIYDTKKDAEDWAYDPCFLRIAYIQETEEPQPQVG